MLLVYYCHIVSAELTLSSRSGAAAHPPETWTPYSATRLFFNSYMLLGGARMKTLRKIFAVTLIDSYKLLVRSICARTALQKAFVFASSVVHIKLGTLVGQKCQNFILLVSHIHLYVSAEIEDSVDRHYGVRITCTRTASKRDRAWSSAQTLPNTRLAKRIMFRLHGKSSSKPEFLLWFF